jgi:hypothetical protein
VSAALLLLAEAARLGVRVFREGERLRYRAEKPPPADLLDRLRQHRAELAALVKAPAEPAPPAPVAILDVEPGHRIYPLRVVVDSIAPVAATVEIRPGVRVIDVELARADMLGDLAVAARRYGETCAGERFVRDATEHGERIEELIEDLAKLGCRVRVVDVQ